MNVAAWKKRNSYHLAKMRLTHPWPLYKKAGGINAVVKRADGSVEDLGRISTTYVKRGWGVSSS